MSLMISKKQQKNVKNLSVYDTVYASYVTPLKQQKIIVFDSMKYKSQNVALQDELLYVT